MGHVCYEETQTFPERGAEISRTSEQGAGVLQFECRGLPGEREPRTAPPDACTGHQNINSHPASPTHPQLEAAAFRKAAPQVSVTFEVPPVSPVTPRKQEARPRH